MLQFISSYLNDHKQRVSFDHYFHNNVNVDLNKIAIRVSENHGLVLNEIKSQLLVFGSQELFNNNNFKIKINGADLHFTTCVKNLGVYVDSCLRCKTHVSH